MQAKVHIAIVNWNSGEWLRRCVASIADHQAGLVDRIVVVDNCSSDGSAELGQCGVPLNVIAAGDNLGFARASNLAARNAAAPYLLFLNPDAALNANSLRSALAFMEGPEAARVGVCGIRLIDEQGCIQRHSATFPTARTFLGSATGLNRIFPRLFPPLLMVDFDHLSSRRVDHVIGAFYLIRRELFETLGGFDERFFLYLEDLDLSLRVREAGWHVYYLAEATAFHKGGGTSEHVKARRLFYSLRSRILYAFKHFRRRQAWAVALATLLIEPLPRLIRALARLSAREAGETLRAFFWLWRDSPSLLHRAREQGKDRLSG